MTDPLMEMVGQARAELLKRHGSFEGVVKHLQKLDQRRARNARRQSKPVKRTNKTGTK